MPSSTLRCCCKIFAQLSAPIQGLLMDAFIMFLVESMKFCVILLLIFGIGYFIFNVWCTVIGDRKSEVHIKTERLSAGLIEDGSFSKYPYVIELPKKDSETTRMGAQQAVITVKVEKAAEMQTTSKTKK